MSSDQSQQPGRRVRPEPQRTGPRRDPMGYFNAGGHQDPYAVHADSMQAGFAAAESLGDEVGPSAVEQGYRVLNDYMEAGGGFGDPGSAAGPGFDGGADPLSSMGSAMDLLSTYSRLWREYLDLLSNTAQMTMQRWGARGPMPQHFDQGDFSPFDVHSRAFGQPMAMGSAMPGGIKAQAAEPPAPAGARFETRIRSDRFVTVRANWRRGVPAEGVRIQGPYPLTSDAPPLKASLDYDIDQDCQVLSLTVEPANEAGEYAGAVFGEDGTDHGYLMVTVQED